MDRERQLQRWTLEIRMGGAPVFIKDREGQWISQFDARKAVKEQDIETILLKHRVTELGPALETVL